MNMTPKNALFLLTVITALVHFTRALADPEIRTLFMLNAAGYLVLGTLFTWTPSFLANQRGLLKWTFFAYTAVTLILYFVWGFSSGEWTIPMGPADKVIEIIMLATIWRTKI